MSGRTEFERLPHVCAFLTASNYHLDFTFPDSTLLTLFQSLLLMQRESSDSRTRFTSLFSNRSLSRRLRKFGDSHGVRSYLVGRMFPKLQTRMR